MASTEVPPLTAHLMNEPQAGYTGPQMYPTPHVNREEIELARDKVPWHAGVWHAIDRAVAHEVHRTSVVSKFMPHLKVSHHVTNVEQDVVLNNLPPFGVPFVPPTQVGSSQTSPTLAISETATIIIVELSLKIGMSPAQVKKENERHPKQTEHHEMPEAAGGHPPGHEAHAMHHDYSSTALMLFRRGANTLTLARDALVLLGQSAFPTTPPSSGGSGIPLFSSQTIFFSAIPTGGGLTCLGGSPTPLESIPVFPVNTPAGSSQVPAQYSTSFVAAASKAVTDLVANGYGGPFVGVVPQYIFADSLVPLAAGPVTALIRPADIIVPQLTAGYFPSVVLPCVSPPLVPNPGGNPLGFGGLPQGVQGVGFVCSIGGDVVQFVNGLDPVAAFSQIDTNGNFIFLLKTRATVKISDPNAVVQVLFM